MSERGSVWDRPYCSGGAQDEGVGLMLWFVEPGGVEVDEDGF